LKLLQRTLSICIAFVVALLLSCATTKPGVETTAAGPGPTNLTAKPRSGALELRWDTNRKAGDLIKGYMIYVAEEGERFIKQSQEPYPGDNNSETAFETYPLEGLTNGKRYRVYVTTVFPGNAESAPSDTVESIPRPEGRVLLAESFSGTNDGFSFSQDKHVPTNDVDNDIYLAVIDGKAYLASPSRIDYVLRTTKFYKLGSTASIDSVDVSRKPPGMVQLLAIGRGDAILFQDENNSYGLIYIRSVKSGDKQVAEFDYIYQPRRNTLIFH
jgi:hypothetical protein